MKLKFLLLLTLITLIISIIATIIILTLEHIFGGDKVFIGALISIPFLLILCILTDNRIRKQ
jgi:hypothetical protein